jgi:methyltransferase (TIGR00027 family)
MVSRSPNDSWGITKSVGVTALNVASFRAAETGNDQPLIQDPFAQLFLDAVGDSSLRRTPGRSLPPELVEEYPELPAVIKARADYIACRTALFDEEFLSAADAGVRQVVILAAGLDARAWRLPWPAGTTVYELDQPKVLEFKSATLRKHQPNAIQVDVAVDLRDDWPTILQRKGFDLSEPSVWLVEGLLPYLSARDQDLLFEKIVSLTTTDSRIAVETLAGDFLDSDRLIRRRNQGQRYRAALAKLRQTEVPDVDDLWYFEERTDVAEWLRARGWRVRAVTASQLMSRYRRSVSVNVQDHVPPSVFVTGLLP